MSRKLIADEKFTPLELREDDEYFPNGIFIFNITRLLEFIALNHAKFKTERISVEEIPDYSSNLNESHLENVDLDKPVIFGEITPGIYNLIDGHHRVDKARRLGIAKIVSYYIDIETLQPFFVSEEAYRKHIVYWNSKLELL